MMGIVDGDFGNGSSSSVARACWKSSRNLVETAKALLGTGFFFSSHPMLIWLLTFCAALTTAATQSCQSSVCCVSFLPKCHQSRSVVSSSTFAVSLIIDTSYSTEYCFSLSLLSFGQSLCVPAQTLLLKSFATGVMSSNGTTRVPSLFLSPDAAAPRGSPRRERHARALAQPLILAIASPRTRDPDAFSDSAFNDRDIFDRFLASASPQQNTTAKIPTNSALLPNSRHKGVASPRPAVPVPPLYGGSQVQEPRQRLTKRMLRPHSPVSDAPPETVVTFAMMQQISPRASPRTAILTTPDVDKINSWLRSLREERRESPSYFLYCQTLQRECAVLSKGKPTPNRLQTAIAFHCLCEAAPLFSRHEDVLHRICCDLGDAIFMPTTDAEHASWDDNLDALDFYTSQLTYYDHQRVLQQQRDVMDRELRAERAKVVEREKEDKINHAKIKDLEARYKIKALEKISQRNTAHDELNAKLQAVLQGFQYMDEGEKQKIVLGVVDALRAHITADTLIAITDQLSLYEREKLLRELFQSDIAQLTDRIRSEVISTSSAQQNAILERSAARITRFQTLIWDRLRSGSTADGTTEATAKSAHDDDDLCDQDRKVLESITDVIDELHAAKKKAADLEQQLHDAEQAINTLRWKSNQQLNEAQDAAIRHAKEIVELREELTPRAVEKEEKAIQTDRRKGGDGDGDDDDDGQGGGSSGGGKSRRRRGGSADEDDDLIVKNRRVNQNGFGIASLIEQAKIPSSKIRKILAKRKPLTLNELHAIIVGYYQAKMFQDIQDDNVGKPRGNLAQFIMDMYTLHYGLKDLAISQLVFLDASIRKHAAESARVRTFGLLTGSLEPESHACSVQGIDFFLFIIIVVFNAGVYKRGRKQSVHIAHNLKGFFGEGIFMSPKSVTLKSDVICSTIDLIFSFTRNEPGGKLDRLKDEIRVQCASQALSVNGGMEVDVALEKIMNYWFVLYEQQIEDIYGMFSLVDTNGDGTLDFREFCEVVQTLEPDMDRREILGIYNKAAGDDHVIDKDEFVQVMLAHQRGVILKEFYSGDSNKKILSGIEQRKQTLGSSLASNTPNASAQNTVFDASLQYKTLTGGLAHLDREESYASLLAAMNAVTESLQPFENDVPEEEVNDTVEDDGASHVQNDVSFMTLSRLSVWASEAKGKMMGAPPLTEADEEAQDEVPVVAPPGSTSRPRTSTPGGLVRIAERTQLQFEQDVNALLEQALVKANVDLSDLFS